MNDNITTNISFTDVRKLSERNLQINEKLTLAFTYNYQQTAPVEQWSQFWDGIFFIKNIDAANFQE